MEIELKQFVVVPKKPKMSKGKIASQVAHATYMALKKQGFQSKIHKQWIKNGMCVIVLECETQVELMNIAKYCEQWNIHHHLYIDEGITEIPMGTATALATGVMPSEAHWMFSQLELFKQ